MIYFIELNEEERNLLMQDALEMTKDEEFYDKETAEVILYKLMYAKRTDETSGKHFTEGD